MLTATQALLLFFSTFLLVGILTPLMRKIALRLNFVDYPDSSHKSHNEAVPYVAVISRLRRRKSIFQGGRDHLSHRLIRRGFSKKQSATTLWSLSLIFVAMAAQLARNSMAPVGMILLALTFWVTLLYIFLQSSDS